MPSFKYKTGKDFSEYKEKFLARKAVNKAVKQGTLLKPYICQMCNKEENLEAHHIDYSQPLKVYWLCKLCHCKVHTKYSLLNPNNYIRNPVKYNDENCSATIHSSVSFDLFVLLKKIADENGTTLSALVRTAVINEYAQDIDQGDFIRDEYKKTAELPCPLSSRIQNLVVDENCMLQQEINRVQKLRSEGNSYLPGMEELFRKVC